MTITNNPPIAQLYSRRQREQGHTPRDALSLPDPKAGVSRAKLMKIRTAQATQIILTDLDGLDLGEIHLLVNDLGDHRGEISVRCGGYNWGAMGTDSTLALIAGCDEDYLLNCLCPTNKTTDNLAILRKVAMQAVLVQRRRRELSKGAAFARYHACTRIVDARDSYSLLEKIFGDAWHHEISQMPCPAYAYRHKIMQNIRDAAKQLHSETIG
jgi:hypothetical protein